MSPEQFCDKSSAASDCWALGFLLYEMLTGKPPFGGNTESETGRRIQKADYLSPVKLNANVSLASGRLIGKLLTMSPERRLTAPQVLEVLQNPALPDTLGSMKSWWGKVKP